MTVMHNTDDDSASLVNNLFDNYPEMFNTNGGKANWTLAEGETYTEYYKKVNEDLVFEEDQMIAYVVNKTVSNANKQDINVVLYGNVSSDGAM